MPLAPPRMLSSLGFLDTMAVFGPSAYGDSTTATVANQFAAMPSLHVGWALLIAVVVVRTARTPWRWVAVLHPTITVLVVVATANHYWVDAIAAALLLLLALAVTPQPYAPSPVAAWWSGRRTARAVAAARRAATCWLRRLASRCRLPGPTTVPPTPAWTPTRRPTPTGVACSPAAPALDRRSTDPLPD